MAVGLSLASSLIVAVVTSAIAVARAHRDRLWQEQRDALTELGVTVARFERAFRRANMDELSGEDGNAAEESLALLEDTQDKMVIFSLVGDEPGVAAISGAFERWRSAILAVDASDPRNSTTGNPDVRAAQVALCELKEIIRKETRRIIRGPSR